MISTKAIHSILLIAVVCFCQVLVEGIDTVSYEFGDDCSVSFEEVNEDRQIYVEYNGKKVGFLCDYFSFEGQGKEILDEYEVCVTPIYFQDPDCAVRLDYQTSYGGKTLQSVTCDKNYNTKYCGPRDDFFYINFEKRDSKSTSNARFKLLVTANKVFDYGGLVGAIIGGVIGGIVLITVVTGVVCFFVCRRKPTQGRVLNPSQTNQTPMGVQPTYPLAAYPTQPLTNTTPFPTANYATQYSSGFTQPPQAGVWQQEEKQASAPPLSYSDVTN
ncbi:uncharacterized protein LOC125656135 [Ostrea edulis]|uniref:uncharacterized protein LOC125656135 n=1 Tax=Ostrea edulis TaxID=37623 RepID=UPI002094ED23|nr:uncharacterized protein LOC125656135 [Ostrea edulis]